MGYCYGSSDAASRGSDIDAAKMLVDSVVSRLTTPLVVV